MADGTRGKGDRKEPPDDEAALSARLQRLGERLENASRLSENVTGPRQTADASAYARHQLGRKPETAGVRRSIGGLTRTGYVFGWPARIFEPFAETLEPRGESSLVVRRFLAITFAARAVSHAFDSRGLKGLALDSAALKAARTILIGYVRVKKRAWRSKCLILEIKCNIFRPLRRRCVHCHNAVN